MVQWLVTCNGGPNDATVGTEKNSLGKACGALESMMRSLTATIGQVEKLDPKQRKLDQIPVKTEAEALK